MDTTFTASHRGGSGPPLVCLHGFTDTWRSWEMMLPHLEPHFEVFAPTLPGHAGGPPLPEEISIDSLIDALEQLLDQAGIETAHLLGNSLGGFAAAQLAARGRARSVVALAPAGGWAADNPLFHEVMDYFLKSSELVKAAAVHADAIAASPEGRQQATQMFAANGAELPADLVAHMIRGAAASDSLPELIEVATREPWTLAAEQIICPVRIAWGTEDRILTLPAAAERYRNEWLPQAEWIELEGLGHCPQLDDPLVCSQLVVGFGT